MTVSLKGKHFEFSGLRLLPRTLQRPSPPRWTAVVSTDSARRAARRGLKISTGFNSTATVKAIQDACRCRSTFSRAPGSGTGTYCTHTNLIETLYRPQNEIDRVTALQHVQGQAQCEIHWRPSHMYRAHVPLLQALNWIDAYIGNYGWLTLAPTILSEHGFSTTSSLASLAERLAGARLAKGDRLTDWTRRPLRPEQRAYAAADVEYLFTIHDALIERLTAAGRLEWALDECAERRQRDRLGSQPGCG